MKFARREGAQLFLVTLHHSVRADMLEHSDLVLDLPVRETLVAPADLVVREAAPTYLSAYRAGLD